MELRTTIRSLPTYDSYIESVLNGISTAPSVLSKRIIVVVLLSIDRSRSVDIAMETVNLAHKYSFICPVAPIVGIDLSGNPKVL